MKSETREDLKKGYSKPEVVRYGTIEALTAGGNGNVTDAGNLLSAVSG
jgi:hypothetical protein